jgi:hypothetical protein
MSRSIPVWLCAIVALVALTGAAVFRPAPVLAASATLNVETSLHDSPDPAAPVLAIFVEGTIVSIDGPPVEGFYPVTTGDLSGWMRGETLHVEKDTPESQVAEGTEVDPRVDETDELTSVEVPGDLEPATDSAAAASAVPEEAPPVAEPTVGEEALPVAEPVPAEELPLANESARVGELAPEDAAAVAPGAQSPPPETGSLAPEAAAEPPTDPNVTPIPAVEVSPAGPASVMVEAPILAGPGPEYGFIATAPAGSTVEKTGHVINGYVTVQYAEVTGWVAFEHLGAPGTGAVTT